MTQCKKFSSNYTVCPGLQARKTHNRPPMPANQGGCPCGTFQSIYEEIMTVIAITHSHIHTSRTDYQINFDGLVINLLLFLIHETASYLIYYSAIQLTMFMIVWWMHISFWILGLKILDLIAWSSHFCFTAFNLDCSLFPILQSMCDIFCLKNNQILAFV